MSIVFIVIVLYCLLLNLLIESYNIGFFINYLTQNKLRSVLPSWRKLLHVLGIKGEEKSPILWIPVLCTIVSTLCLYWYGPTEETEEISLEKLIPLLNLLIMHFHLLWAPFYFLKKNLFGRKNLQEQQ